MPFLSSNISCPGGKFKPTPDPVSKSLTVSTNFDCKEFNNAVASALNKSLDLV